MNNLHTHLHQFIATATTHQRLDREYRAAWRYRHQQDMKYPAKHAALQHTERAALTLLQTIIALPEPDYLSRQARDLLEKWDNYRRNWAIYLAEKHNQNLRHVQTSRKTFDTALGETADIIKKLMPEIQ